MSDAFPICCGQSACLQLTTSHSPPARPCRPVMKPSVADLKPPTSSVASLAASPSLARPRLSLPSTPPMAMQLPHSSRSHSASLSSILSWHPTSNRQALGVNVS
jgi:hypothetical protein